MVLEWSVGALAGKGCAGVLLMALIINWPMSALCQKPTWRENIVGLNRVFEGR